MPNCNYLNLHAQNTRSTLLERARTRPQPFVNLGWMKLSELLQKVLVHLYKANKSDGDWRTDSPTGSSLMKTLPILLLLTACGAMQIADPLSPPTEIPQSAEADFCEDVVAEMNLARTQPRVYAQMLAAWLPYYHGNVLELPGKVALQTQEGARATEEAMQYLQRTQPLPPLKWSDALAQAALVHVREQAGGAIGHAGQDGSTPGERMRRFVPWLGMAGENIAYGPSDARDAVMELLIDDGVPDRGHRGNIFQPGYGEAGAAVGPHGRFRLVWVVDFLSAQAK